MRTGYLCVLVHVWVKGEVGAPLSQVKPSGKIFYWPFKGGASFVDLLCFCSVLCLLCLCARLFVCALWSPAEGGGGAGLLALVYGVWLSVCGFPVGVQGRVWYLIVSTHDPCTLTYIEIFHVAGCIWHNMGLDVRKPVFGGLRATRTQTSMLIRADWSAPLLFVS